MKKKEQLANGEKRKKKWPWIVAAVVILAGIGGAIGGGEKKETDKKAEASKEVDEDKEIVAYIDALKSATEKFHGPGVEFPEDAKAYIITDIDGDLKDIRTLDAIVDGKKTRIRLSATMSGEKPEYHFFEFGNEILFDDGFLDSDDPEEPSQDPEKAKKDEAQGQTETTSAGNIEQDNASKAAADYLAYTSFSHSGLVEQLKYEGYSEEIAIYAADNCGADWNEQALKKASEYLDYSGFSHSGLIKQLEYDGFSAEQAAYGADGCGADWNEQAAKTAQEYIDYSSFSRDGLIEQLEYDGFTKEQAEHGVTAVGY